MKRDPIVAGFLLLVLAASIVAAVLSCAEPRQQLPLVKADWPVCFRLVPQRPLIPPKHSINGRPHVEETA